MKKIRRWHGVSGGVGSWLAAKVDMQAHPEAEHRFIFADTLYEDADCYRFLLLGISNLIGEDDVDWIPEVEEFPDYRVEETTPIAEYSGNPKWRDFLKKLRREALYRFPQMEWLVEGRDVWEIMRDERMLGNSRFDPCSKLAKRQMLDRWQKKNCDPQIDYYTIGIGPHEAHRYTALAERKLKEGGWKYFAPLIDTFEGEVYRAGLELKYLQKAGLQQPRLYALNYAHNNCGGFCIKAGHAHWLNRLRSQPDRFRYDAIMEQKIIDHVGGNVQSILSDRRGDGKKKAMTLFNFAKRYEKDKFTTFSNERGESGCGCMIDYSHEDRLKEILSLAGTTSHRIEIEALA